MSTLKQGSRLCFKLTESWGGNGFRAIELNKDGLIRICSPALYKQLRIMLAHLSQAAGWVLIERYIEQHPDYAALNSSSVNTIRCVCDVADDVNVDVDSLFSGRSREFPGDNATSGGTIYPIDLEKRRLLPGFKKKTPHLNTLKSGYRRDDGREGGSDVNGSYQFVETCTAGIPGIRFSGTDIAFSMTGPVVLEMNILPDYADLPITVCHHNLC